MKRIWDIQEIKELIMTVRIYNGGNDTILREDNVGSSLSRICYPEISSCITVTGVLANGLIGTHITFRTTMDEINEMFQIMKRGGGGNCLNFYVIGKITQFKSSTKEHAFNKRKKIREKIKSVLNKNATIRFYDSFTQGAIHVFVEKHNGNTSFYWVKSAGYMVQGFTYPTFAGRTLIPQNQFVIR